MSKNAFLREYAKEYEAEPGIKGLTMNAPLVPVNKLGDVGIELEIEGRDLPPGGLLAKIVGPKSKAQWTVHADGSLRGGQEYVLSTPCQIDETDALVNDLYSTMRGYGTRLMLSNRCSTHVHVNVGGKKINHLTSVIALWSTFEESLVNWCGEERRSNHFCLTSKDQGRTIDLWDAKLSGNKPEWVEGMKYTSLNLLPMRTQGSIEFRCMRADEDPQPIIDWTKFCHGLVEYASDRFSNPSYLANELSERGGRGIFQDICRRSKTTDRFTASVLDHDLNRDFDGLAMEGFRRAQPLVLGYPWADWLPLIDKPYIPSPFAKEKKTRDAAPDWAMPIFEPEPDPIRRRGARIAQPIVAPPPELEVAPRPQGPLNPGRRVDPDLPIMFGDGTPGVVEERRIMRGMIQVRPVGRLHEGWRAVPGQGIYWYDLGDGRFNGARLDDRNYPWIMNGDA